jgi:hypothetical protein
MPCVSISLTKLSSYHLGEHEQIPSLSESLLPLPKKGYCIALLDLMG